MGRRRFALSPMLATSSLTPRWLAHGRQHATVVQLSAAALPAIRVPLAPRVRLARRLLVLPVVQLVAALLALRVQQVAPRRRRA